MAAKTSPVRPITAAPHCPTAPSPTTTDAAVRLRTIIEVCHVIMQANHNTDPIEGNDGDRDWIAGMLAVPSFFVSMITADFGLPDVTSECSTPKVREFLDWMATVGQDTVFAALTEGRAALEARYEADPEAQS